MAKFLTPEEVGLYGIITVAILSSLLFVGLDFFQFANRQLVIEDKSQYGRILKTQLMLYGAMYLFFIPVSAFLFSLNHYSFELYAIFVAILCVEHINEELVRVLTMLKKPIIASVLMAVRQIGWGVGVPVLMFIFPEHRHLLFLLIVWLVVGLTSLILGSVYVYRLNFEGWRLPINIMWIRKGLLQVVPLLISTLILRAIFTIDRYWLSQLTNLEVVAAYVLFVGVASVINVVVEAAVTSIQTPLLVESVNNNDFTEYRRLVLRMFLKVFGLVLVSVVLILILLPYLLGWISNSVYIKYSFISNWVISAFSFYAFSLVFQTALYALKEDRKNMLVTVSAAIIFVLTVLVGLSVNRLMAIPYALSMTLFYMLVARGYFWLSIVRNKLV